MWPTGNHKIGHLAGSQLFQSLTVFTQRFCMLIAHLWSFCSALLPILPHWAPLFGDCNFRMIICGRSCSLCQLSSLQRQGMVLHSFTRILSAKCHSIWTRGTGSSWCTHTHLLDVTGARCLMAATLARKAIQQGHLLCSFF